MASNRQYSFFDRLCLGFDEALRAITDNTKSTDAPYPAQFISESVEESQRKHSAGLMRVNHAGEVCAQALYHGQAMVSKSPATYDNMRKAAMEEGDHLIWCRKRLTELGSHTSYLNPLWYAGSFCIGMAAGMVGDKWSLGFIVETERQVIDHLAGHLNQLSTQDQRSYKVLQQMQQEEAKHRDEAVAAGAEELPDVVKKAMNMVSKIMVKTAYWL